MNVAELLITGFDGDKAIFAASLAPNMAATVVACVEGGRESTVEVCAEQATPAFTSIRRLVEDLARPTSSLP
ncbi:hypothetical protein Rhe02_87590 [Rhizocola hellebori]|uniref:Uncharacterized protein n=1 Tax=Rhizocola hellebori TaxID=1392758 RepID=A0A8J3VLI3_9ACTN|nr:hypothetical protein [Rhizocola hellebori]GIH10692.1 hypothetical protein Rhe02_87590 [Rhizocola hellebori]